MAPRHTREGDCRPYNGATAYPLQWPPGWRRTEPERRRRSRYRVTLSQARGQLMAELGRLGARGVVLSTDLPTRKDGLPYAIRRNPDDPGAVVYWTDLLGRQRALPCDCWLHLRDNVRALGLALEAQRALDRCGAGEIVERAYEAYALLPETAGESPWVALGLDDEQRTERDVRRAFLARVAAVHPDHNGGDEGPFRRLVAARDEALRMLTEGEK